MARYRVSPHEAGGFVNVREEPDGRAVSLLRDGDEFDGTKEGDWVRLYGGYVLASLTRQVRAAKAEQPAGDEPVAQAPRRRGRPRKAQ